MDCVVGCVESRWRYLYGCKVRENLIKIYCLNFLEYKKMKLHKNSNSHKIDKTMEHYIMSSNPHLE